MLSLRSKNLLSPIEYLKGVGERRAGLLHKEKGIRTFADLLLDFPFRYVDKSKIHRIGSIRSFDDIVQVKGVLRHIHTEGQGHKKRLKAELDDGSGRIELVWFKGLKWMMENLETGTEYVAYGKLNLFRGKKSIPHPELERWNAADRQEAGGAIEPVYSSTEKLSTRGMDTKGLRRLTRTLVDRISNTDIPENIPGYILQKLKLCSRYEAFTWIHFPPSKPKLQKAIERLKFEELFFTQLRLVARKIERKKTARSYSFTALGKHFHNFYGEMLPFELTDAQKRVLREIRLDVKSGYQMNRLLQGDVGSGKTVVALMSMLMSLDNGFQACLMAPTEILAQQHYKSIGEMLEGSGIRPALLTGSIKGKVRKQILYGLAQGDIDILIGTHALLEDPVRFQKLGLAITDEQHRFGVEQRARLWKKAHPWPPHILVMTATPIPRTLALTYYGDLDVSVIDELPPGRKPVLTKHIRDAHRPQLIKFMKEQIKEGRQVYVVFPLIEESAALDLQNLQDGYEDLLNHFPRPEYQIGVVHGRMKPEDKDEEMKRFASGKTQILVATTVIEVGVNVPNASIMVIENAERFGISQLHQLRGRVGRGAAQSYCLLVSGNKLSKEARQRLKVMCSTNDGFRIAEEDMKLRGPGDMEGTRQSGELGFRLVNLATDGDILHSARNISHIILKDDPGLEKEVNKRLRVYMASEGQLKKAWSRIG